MKHPIRSLLGLLCVAGLTVLLYDMRGAPLAGTGWVAKRTCSGVFVAGRAPDSLVEASLPMPLPVSIAASLDRARRSVTASFPGGLFASTARYRPGLGCTLEGPGDTPSPLDTVAPRPKATGSASGPWLPTGRAPAGLAEVIDRALERSPRETARGHGTRAIVILHEGRVVVERYSEGFDAATPLPGWSMTKGVTNALVGLLVDAGRLDLDAPVALDEWSKPGDPRGRITWDELLRMSSGLRFSESYVLPSSDAIQMLFGLARFSKGAYAASLALEYPVDRHWSYASGTTNLIQYALLTRVFEGDLERYLTFPREALFAPLGMSSAVLEPDARGSFVGSSFMFATARDWARFGLLFLNDGLVDGRRVLSREWVRYSATPTPTNQAASYGAHWWLNADPERGARRWPGLPADLLIASGFEGQWVVVVPDARLVIVRLGLDRAWPFDMAGFVEQVLETLADSP